MSLSMSKSYRRWPSWFRGDFHAHTNHSDGALSPPQLLAEARARNLDFFSITDHNVLSAYDLFGPHDDMLIIPGCEITLHYGHFNMFGFGDGDYPFLDSLPTDKASYRVQMQTGEVEHTPSELMRLSREAGLLNSINHPLLSVWRWIDGDTDLRSVDFIEIWNDPTWPENDWGNPDAVTLWTSMLNAGHRLTAIGGTDFHNPEPAAQADGSMIAGDRLNSPTTHVYAQELSGNAIMAALKQRRAYMSMGPTVSFGGRMGDTTLMMGDDAGAVDGRMQVQTTVRGEGKLTAQLVSNGEVIAEARGDGGVQLALGVGVSAEIPQWHRIDVRDEHNAIVAVTNPIFSGPAITPTKNKFGDFAIDGKLPHKA